MRRLMVAMFVSLIVFGCVIGVVADAQEQKHEQILAKSAVVCEYKGLKRGSDQLWMVFEVFTSDPKRHEDVWVPPWKFSAAPHSKGFEEHDRVRLDYNLEKNRGYADGAMLFVDDTVAREQWNKYSNTLLAACAYRCRLREAIVVFENGIGALVIATPKNDLCSIPAVGAGRIKKVVAALDQTVLVIEDKIEETELFVDWGLACAKEEIATSGPDRWYGIVVKTNLEIHAQKGSSAEYWQEKLREWRKKFGPRVVFPPAK